GVCGKTRRDCSWRSSTHTGWTNATQSPRPMRCGAPKTTCVPCHGSAPRTSGQASSSSAPGSRPTGLERRSLLQGVPEGVAIQPGTPPDCYDPTDPMGPGYTQVQSDAFAR